MAGWILRICLYVSMPSRAWVVTKLMLRAGGYKVVSMPSRAWVVTWERYPDGFKAEFQCPHGLELLRKIRKCTWFDSCVSMPSWAWVVTWRWVCCMAGICVFQCPHGLELLRGCNSRMQQRRFVSMPSWAWVVTAYHDLGGNGMVVSMPSWAWVVTIIRQIVHLTMTFQCPHGLELLRQECPIF